MAISDDVRKYIEGQLEYYTGEAESYLQMAESLGPGSAQDTAFGIITGCVYSAFLRALSDGGKSPSLEDIQEFGQMMRERAPDIRGALNGI